MKQPRFNSNHLQMFMSPREILATHRLGDAMPGDSHATVMSRKYEEAKQYGLADSVKAQGVTKPVALYHRNRFAQPEVMNGHHRLAVAMHIAPDTPIPITHSDADHYNAGALADNGRDTWQHHKVKVALEARASGAADEQNRQSKQDSKRRAMGL